MSIASSKRKTKGCWRRGERSEIVVCDGCNGTFKRFKSSNRKFCRRECYLESRRPKVKICPACKKEFTSPRKPDKIYCSRKCQSPFYGGGIKHKRYHQYQKSAQSRNIEFSLSTDEFLSFWQKPCTYCGAEIETIGLDRLENHLGYVLGNVVPCCRDCNVMKMSQGLGEFIARVERVFRFSRYGEKIHGHSLSFVDPEAKIGANVKIWQFASVLKDAVIGDSVSIGAGAEIGRGCVIGENSRIAHGVFLPPNSKIGRNVFIGPSVTFTDDKNPRVGNVEYFAQPPIVEDMAAIGAGAVVLPGVHIGWGALVGAGSIVTKDVPARITVMGNPARIYERSDK